MDETKTTKRDQTPDKLNVLAIISAAFHSLPPASAFHASGHARGHDPREQVNRIAKQRRRNEIAKISRRKNR